MRCQINRKGFTLIEILVVVIIVGVLATLGFVNYGGVREKQVTKEAIANLKLIAAAQRIYRMEIGVYFPVTGGGATADVPTINTGLRLSLPTGGADQRWTYAISNATTINFTTDATRSNGTCQYRITAGNTVPTPVAGTGCPP